MDLIDLLDRPTKDKVDKLVRDFAAQYPDRSDLDKGLNPSSVVAWATPSRTRNMHLGGGVWS